MNLQVRKAVYTFIIGDYDTLKTPNVMTEGWDYICFTDNPKLRSTCWDVRLSTRQGADHALEDKKFAIKHMILFHEYLDGYELSLSIGGQGQINCNLDDLFRQHFKEDDDMMICCHPEQDCIYDEAEVCKALEKDDPPRIDAQMQRYREAGYPPHNGLYTSGIIGRRHDRQNLKDMCAFWFEEFKRGSKRDQLSLNYAIWRSAPISISEINFQQQYFSDRNFIIYPHLKARPVESRLNLNPFHDWTKFDNGLPISPIIIELYLHVEHGCDRWPNPHTTSATDSFFAWLNAPAEDDPMQDSSPLITNLAAYLHRARVDVQTAYPDLFGDDRKAFTHWFLNHASKEYALPDAFLEPVRYSFCAS